MIALGIESTAHTFGAGIFDGKRILAEVRSVYRPEKGWGIVPLEAAKHHRQVCQEVVDKTLSQAGLKLSDIDLLAFSRGPGLPLCLQAGYEWVRKQKPEKIGVNHCIAHLEIARWLTGFSDPVCVYVSGANTQIVSWVSGKYRVFGETQDIGIGNALDKFGREAGLSFPAGPEIEKLAKKGKWVELPYTVKGMDLSFSGILSQAKRLLGKERLENLCFSLQEVFFAMVTEVAERALAHLGKNQLILTGGVSANLRLQEMLETMCRERGARFAACPRQYAGDNGAMIALTGFLMKKAGLKSPIKPRPAERTDEPPWPEKVFKYKK